jgi:hypothetical protein
MVARPSWKKAPYQPNEEFRMELNPLFASAGRLLPALNILIGKSQNRVRIVDSEMRKPIGQSVRLARPRTGYDENLASRLLQALCTCTGTDLEQTGTFRMPTVLENSAAMGNQAQSQGHFAPD